MFHKQLNADEVLCTSKLANDDQVSNKRSASYRTSRLKQFRTGEFWFYQMVNINVKMTMPNFVNSYPKTHRNRKKIKY